MLKGQTGYNRARLTTIVLIMVLNSGSTVFNTLHHHYPQGLAAVLFLIPGLNRELDLRSGRPARKLGTFEWSCFIAGFLFLAVLPFLIG